MAKAAYKIPFDPQGNQMHYPHGTWDYKAGVLKLPEFRDNSVFWEELTYKGYARGRSAAYFEFTRSDGTSVTMFLTDMEKVIPHMLCGVVTGNFTFTKRGQNYGIQLVLP